MDTGVLFEDMRLFQKLDSFGFNKVDRIYSPERPFFTWKGKWIQLLPYIVREEDELSIQMDADGVLVRNMEALGRVLQAGFPGEIVADFSLNAWNSYARKALRGFGVHSFTVPLELTMGELKETFQKDNRAQEERRIIHAYGYVPLMVTAQCSHINQGSPCTGKGRDQTHDTRLSDRKQISFHAVSYCQHCYNVIYNSVPTNLLHKMDEIGDFFLNEADEARLSFTIEDPRTIQKVLACFLERGSRKDSLKPNEFTYGHYKGRVL